MFQRTSAVPLYHQLKQLLCERIERGEYKPGDLIPGEHDLQEAFKLSRTTVRQALQELERAGYVTRHRGRGTFVTHHRIHSPDPVAPLADHLRAQGLHPGWRVLSADIQVAPLSVAERLRLAPGARVFCSRRLRLADDQPIGYLVAYVPAALAGVIKHDQLGAGGSRDYLRGGDLLRGSQSERTLEAAAADLDEASILSLTTGSPVLKIHRRTVGPDGRPVEDCCGTYRGDRFRYRVGWARDST